MRISKVNYLPDCLLPATSVLPVVFHFIVFMRFGTCDCPSSGLTVLRVLLVHSVGINYLIVSTWNKLSFEIELAELSLTRMIICNSQYYLTLKIIRLTGVNQFLTRTLNALTHSFSYNPQFYFLTGNS